MPSIEVNGNAVKTRILPVNVSKVGQFNNQETLEKWELPKDLSGLQSVAEAAEYLKTQSIPVAFPTETVYGLGADATRSDAVKGIYKAKGRPSDNPLIIHVCDLTMLRSLLTSTDNQSVDADFSEIPDIYKPLIKRFWPGPLTVLLPNPSPSKLAPEVTAGLPTFGARMPSSPLALSLIRLAGVPLAAPSANASTKPSCTTAQHVHHDLDGRIEIILDGGACQVGVESTVVDGMCDPPVVLRPGGVSIDEIRECPGWEGVVKGYKDQSEIGDKAPRAPGMKYKHYSPKAKVILCENGRRIEPLFGDEALSIVVARAEETEHTKRESSSSDKPVTVGTIDIEGDLQSNEFALYTTKQRPWIEKPSHQTTGWHLANCLKISLGSEIKDIAHGLFSALRELDQKGCDVIFVEGIKDEGDIAAAVMNRLRKAATVIER
ncbi:yrdC protein [Botrytis cinerea]